MRILIAEPFASDPEVVDALRRQCPAHDFVVWPEQQKPERADLLVSWKIPTELGRLPEGLRAIFCYGAGIEHIVRDPRVPATMPVMRLIDPGQADRMLGYAAAAAFNRLVQADGYRLLQSEREWPARPLPVVPAASLRVAVLGLGQIGGYIAAGLARLGFGVRGWARGRGELPGVTVYSGAPGLAEAVAGADVLVNVLPADPALRDLIGHELLAQLALDAVVVNIGRGEHIELDALREALASHLGAAWLDVLPTEPPPLHHWLWQHPKVRLTPHIAGIPTPGGGAMSLGAAILALEQNTPLPGLVRPGSKQPR
ncbi:MAG: NAD(P)-dependent oxidoreductase [Devosia sp.]|nr:NAD(P)-dependent oxidoreductase [Devosia sp.]